MCSVWAAFKYVDKIKHCFRSQVREQFMHGKLSPCFTLYNMRQNSWKNYIYSSFWFYWKKKKTNYFPLVIQVFDQRTLVKWTSINCSQHLCRLDQNPSLAITGKFSNTVKAFDKVRHKGLLCKVETFGISGKLHKLFQSFLNKMFQRVGLNGQSSSWLTNWQGFLRFQFLDLSSSWYT